MSENMRGTHPGCDNDKPHRLLVDCWEQPDILDSEDDEYYDDDYYESMEGLYTAWEIIDGNLAD